eukprot:6190591-Pleurochrysis_carterae.AAC.1
MHALGAESGGGLMIHIPRRGELLWVDAADAEVDGGAHGIGVQASAEVSGAAREIGGRAAAPLATSEALRVRCYDMPWANSGDGGGGGGNGGSLWREFAALRGVELKENSGEQATLSIYPKLKARCIYTLGMGELHIPGFLLVYVVDNHLFTTEPWSRVCFINMR